MLNPNLDFEEIRKNYLENKFTVIDNLVEVETVKKMRNYSLFSGISEDPRPHYRTINFTKKRNCESYLFNLINDLEEKIPEICVRFERGWTFSFDEECEGVGLHADATFVNLNFWVTPNHCISDFRKNGLIIYPCRPPEEWTFREFNTDDPEQVKKNYAFIEEQGIKPVRIPYKFNRAILFDSMMFHKTDGVKTRPGIDNSRVNYTFLFSGS